MEEWRPYSRVDGFVEISNLGRIRNPKTGRILVQTILKSGYYSVVIKPHGRSGKSIAIRVARAVAQTWIENPNNLPVVNHKDCNKLNNCVSNLEWTTHSENSLHAYANNRMSPPKPPWRLSKEEILYVRENYGRSAKNTFRGLAEKLGTNHETVRHAYYHSDYGL